MTCLGLHYTIFDTEGEDADHFTFTSIDYFGHSKLVYRVCWRKMDTGGVGMEEKTTALATVKQEVRLLFDIETG